MIEFCLLFIGLYYFEYFFSYDVNFLVANRQIIKLYLEALLSRTRNDGAKEVLMIPILFCRLFLHLVL
jgi:hypothetical protein